MAITKNSGEPVRIVNSSQEEIFTSSVPGVIDAGGGLTYSQATATFGRHSTNTTFTVIAGVTLKSHRVVAMKVRNLEALNVHYQSQDTDLSGLVPIGASGIDDYQPVSFYNSYWFTTANSEPFRMQLSSTDTTVNVNVIYHSV